jgi:serine/threonine-protein kinase
MIRPDNSILLTDFGIATFEDAPPVTEVDFIVGSLPYLPPEIFNKERGGPLQDIYACGITLFEMLSGHLPFVGKEAGEIAFQVINRDLPELSKSDPSIPKEIDKIIAKACFKNIAGRYPTLNYMKEDILALKQNKKKNSFIQKIFGRKK